MIGLGSDKNSKNGHNSILRFSSLKSTQNFWIFCISTFFGLFQARQKLFVALVLVLVLKWANRWGASSLNHLVLVLVPVLRRAKGLRCISARLSCTSAFLAQRNPPVRQLRRSTTSSYSFLSNLHVLKVSFSVRQDATPQHSQNWNTWHWLVLAASRLGLNLFPP